MHTHPSLRVASVVAYTTHLTGMPYLLTAVFSLGIGRNVSITPHLLTCILRHVFHNLRHSSLIYIKVPLFARGFPKRKANLSFSKKF